ncbi:MAG: hypothetical protein RIS47_521, partial [Bacteroidota bacterium]
SDMMEAIVASYDVLGWNTVVGYHPFDMLSDIMSDDSYAGGGSITDAPNIIEMDKHKVRPQSGEVHGLWLKYYKGIYRCNMVLANIQGATASDAFKKRVTAEAKFLRAYFYFDLVRLFGNIPLITNPLLPQEYSQKQVAPKLVYDQIASDLVDASADLPGTMTSADNGRASKWAAKSLLARVYLYYKGVYSADLVAGQVTVNQDYALAQLNEVMTQSGHSLMLNFADNFKRSGEFGAESVFEISYSDLRTWWDWGYIQGGEGNIAIIMEGVRDYKGSEYTAGWSFNTVSHNLESAFETGDPRKAATILDVKDLTSTYGVGYQHTGLFNKKYTTAAEYKPTSGQVELNWGNNTRVIRYSDVLLMAAELNALKGNEVDAKKQLNQVRQRARGIESGVLPDVTATGAALLTAIYHERQVEFAMEGLRYWDLMRRGIAVAKTAIELTNYVLKPSDIGVKTDYEITFDTANQGLLPIPQSEIDLSSGVLVQNQGYN